MRRFVLAIALLVGPGATGVVAVHVLTAPAYADVVPPPTTHPGSPTVTQGPTQVFPILKFPIVNGRPLTCVVKGNCPPTKTIVGPLWNLGVTGPSASGNLANNADLTFTQNVQPQGRINVPLSSATFTVAIAYTDDTPSMAGNTDARGDFGLFEFEVDVCMTNADATAAGMLMDLSTINVPYAVQQQPPSYSTVGDCATAAQQPGAWYALDMSAQTLAGSNADLSSFYLSSGTKAAQPGQTITGTLSVEVNFPQVNNVVRFRVGSLLESTQTGCDNGNSNGLGINCGAIQPGESQNVVVNVVVFPTALAQLKVLPYTILYCPPGSSSSSAFTTTFTFGTTMTTGNSTELDNTTKDDNWLSGSETDDTNLGLNMGYSSGGSNIISIDDKLAFSFQNTTRWDHSVQTGTGQTVSGQLATGWQVNTSYGNTLGGGANNANQIPGPAGTLQSAPFWSDVIVLLRHPQIALWNFQGQPVEQLLGGLGSPMAGPVWVTVAIRTLDDCANGKGTYALPTLPPGAGVLEPENLTAAECLALASLDPFYGKGQSAIVGHGPGEAQAGDRGTWAFGDTYGMPLGAQPSDEPSSITDQQITGHWAQAQVMSQTSYNATVEDVFTTSAMTDAKLDGTFSLFGFSVGGSDQATTSSGGETLTNDTTLKVTYQTTTQAKFEQDWTLQAKISDTHVGLVNPETVPQMPYQPDVEIYQDNAFGALMFRDPGAPGLGQFTRYNLNAPCIPCALPQGK
jgi:hypothetical protein